MHKTHDFRTFLSSCNPISKKNSKIYIDPPPRIIQKKLLSSNQIYFHCLTGHVRNEKNDILFRNIEIQCFFFGIVDADGVLTIFIFTSLDKFYPSKNQLFKKWLLEPKNQLIFFNYGYSPFLELLNCQDFIKAQLMDLYIICSRAHNDITDSTLSLSIITQIDLPKLPKRPNWENRENIVIVASHIKALCFLNDHFQKSDYEWENSHDESEFIGLL